MKSVLTGSCMGLVLAFLPACTSDDTEEDAQSDLGEGGAAGETAAGGAGATAGESATGGRGAGGLVSDAAGSTSLENEDGCNGFELETDFAPTPMEGPGVVDGAIPAGDYIITTTYLRMQSTVESGNVFNELINPVLDDLDTRTGLVGFSLGISGACVTTRTLSVWESEHAMVEFATGDAHMEAVRRVGEVSRGGSITMHYTGSETSTTWEFAAERLVEHDGPHY